MHVCLCTLDLKYLKVMHDVQERIRFVYDFIIIIIIIPQILLNCLLISLQLYDLLRKHSSGVWYFGKNYFVSDCFDTR